MPFGETAPTWLERFVAVLRATGATVITFNYDTVLESAVLAHQLTDWSRGQRVMPADVLGHLPPLPPSSYGRYAGRLGRILLPVSDLVVRGMLRKRVGESAGLTVVNLDGAPVQSSLEQLSFLPAQISVVDGRDCVASFVEQLEVSASRALADQLANYGRSADPVCIACSPALASAVVGTRREGSELALIAEAQPGQVDPFRRRDAGEPQPVACRDVFSEAADGPRTIAAEFPDGRVCRLISAHPIVRETGYGNGQWLGLAPTVAPP